ncbi:MAG: hypothetical protein AVDCRST_MAG90-2864, partial [uncultured Microvirga sp.]
CRRFSSRVHIGSSSTAPIARSPATSTSSTAPLRG